MQQKKETLINDLVLFFLSLIFLTIQFVLLIIFKTNINIGLWILYIVVLIITTIILYLFFHTTFNGLLKFILFLFLLLTLSLQALEFAKMVSANEINIMSIIMNAVSSSLAVFIISLSLYSFTSKGRDRLR